MTEHRDSKGHFIKGNVPWNKRVVSSQREMTAFVGRKLIGRGLLKAERVQTICPACGQQVEAIATDDPLATPYSIKRNRAIGYLSGYCSLCYPSVNWLEYHRHVPSVGNMAAQLYCKMM